MARVLTASLLCLTAIACGPPTAGGGGRGGGGGGGGGGSALNTPTQIASAMADAYCAYAERCFSSRLLQAYARMNSMDAMDLGNCRDTALAAGGDIDRIKDALEAERVVFDQERFERCEQAIASATCNGSISACDTLFEGTVEAGGGCFIDEECADGDGEGSCTASDDQCGVCEVLPIEPEAELGASCEELSCADGLECDEENICVEERNSGGAGSACEGGGGDLIGGCDMYSNMLCVDGTCTEAQFSSTEGAECGANGVLCEGDVVCPITTSGATTQCTQPKVVGEACVLREGTTITVTACVTSAFCDFETSQCVAKKADGASCSGDNQCQSGNCDEDSETCAQEGAGAAEPSWRGCD